MNLVRGLWVSPWKFLESKESQKRFKRHSGIRYCFEKFKFGSAIALSHFVTEFLKCHNMSQNFRKVNFVTECHNVTGNPFSALSYNGLSVFTKMPGEKMHLVMISFDMSVSS